MIWEFAVDKGGELQRDVFKKFIQILLFKYFSISCCCVQISVVKTIQYGCIIWQGVLVKQQLKIKSKKSKKVSYFMNTKNPLIEE